MLTDSHRWWISFYRVFLYYNIHFSWANISFHLQRFLYKEWTIKRATTVPTKWNEMESNHTQTTKCRNIFAEMHENHRQTNANTFVHTTINKNNIIGPFITEKPVWIRQKAQKISNKRACFAGTHWWCSDALSVCKWCARERPNERFVIAPLLFLFGNSNILSELACTFTYIDKRLCLKLNNFAMVCIHELWVPFESFRKPKSHTQFRNKLYTHW